MEENSDGLAFCLSEKKDLLSQWRGYAANATGVAIGFNKNYLKWLCGEMKQKMGRDKHMLQKVEYKPSKQDALVRPIFDKVVNIFKSGLLENSAGLLASPAFLKHLAGL